MDWGTLVARVRTLSRVQLIKIGVGVLVLALGLTWYLLFSDPDNFPTHSLITVQENVPLSVIAEDLEQAHVIRSSLMFTLFARVSGSDRSIHAGRYLFSSPLNMFQVLNRIETGEPGIESIRVTLVEGMASFEMARVLETALPDFDTETFLVEAKKQEGYLFPDTYFIEPGTEVSTIIERLRENFEERTKNLGLTREHIIMASLIEKEANTPEDRRLVSGILWNRLEKGMRLQVDATFGYTRGIPSYVPTGNDPDIDSPYNTYLNAGLPKGPITNPGLDSFEASLNPASTSYLYYLTGRDGLMYYANTFEEHKRNRERFLD